jgi:hypothetical protein
MLAANVVEAHATVCHREPFRRVPAQQRKLPCGGERVPQRFEPNRALGIAGFPEQVDHFAVGADSR